MAEYIDKQKFIDELDDKYSLGDIGRMERDIIVDALLYAKPADVRPVVRSQWKKNDNGTYSCKRCHSWIPEEQWHYANWCLYCGADMSGGDADG